MPGAISFQKEAGYNFPQKELVSGPDYYTRPENLINTRAQKPEFVHLLAAFLLWLQAPTAGAYLDLEFATVAHLENGLTLIVLEDHTFPVVSVQTLYRVGARTETTGATGLAHFLEHMAFRSSKNFPDTGLVRSIHAAGGEWHGYTWLDQTTYFATAPAAQLDLLLRIEADRMARLDISGADVTAERGAILAEMHGYDSDPMSALQDELMFVVFLAHPYRNDSFGWESDLANITLADLVDFYQQHYQPGNAVLAVVGDVAAEDVRQRVERYFGVIPGAAATPSPHTVEPVQTGERRMELRGDVDRRYFRIAWRAPSVHDPDYPAFLLLQDLLGGSSGVSFLQNDWGTPVRPGSPLDGIAEDLTTWFPPTEQEYVFTIGGSAPRGADQSAVEDAIGSAMAAFRNEFTDAGDTAEKAMEQAKMRVREALMFDVQTTEDAAHQLAFFTGLDALAILTGLPRAIDRVSANDIIRVLDHYLTASKRTIGWFVPVETKTGPEIQGALPETGHSGGQPVTGARAMKPGGAVDGGVSSPQPETRRSLTEPAGTASMVRLGNGVPVVFQRSALSPTATLKVVTTQAAFPPDITTTANDPLWGTTSLEFNVLPDNLPAAIARAGATLKSATAPEPPSEPDGPDPATLMERYFEELLGLRATTEGVPGSPLLLALCGDIHMDQALPLLEAAFGSLSAFAQRSPPVAADSQKMDIALRLGRVAPREQIGYLVRAPGPGQPEALAWRLTLYIFSHGYEGRLGMEAIGRRGLVYYIDSGYESDGRNGWITLAMGVDPDKQPAVKSLLQSELLRMIQDPPSQQEIDEAKSHLLGRHLSAAQSNPELTDHLARHWLWYGHLPAYDELQRLMDGIRRDDVIRLLPAFVSGSIISIRNPVAERPTADATGQ